MNRKLIIPFLLLAALAGCNDSDDPGKSPDEIQLQIFDPVSVIKTNPMKVWVHYMPWFEDPTTSDNGKWGQHWTMANKNPELIDENGKRQIAAHYYPLIGPYASSDQDVLEYHFLLMKYAGIDGILIDWYGTRELYDYPLNKRNTEAIVAVLEKVGLEFAIVYEDQTLRDEMNSDEQKITQVGLDMEYLEKEFFIKDNYIKIDDKPLLMIFGPQIIKTPEDWNSIFSKMSEKPAFFPLYGHSSLTNNTQYTNAIGEYIWVDGTAMEVKYANKTNFEQYIGGAYPGFNDFYEDGGWGKTALNDIAYEDGKLFENLLKMAKDNKMEYLQLITWNDFGEGTMIEPTQEFGFSFLELTQAFTGIEYTKVHLESIYNYYLLKRQHKNNPNVQKQLTQVFYYLISLQDEKAIKLMEGIEK
ncbi:MAG TPA: glycoside hydrolase family 71/99-like protein [Salinimicrobium sp.]|nr:glycoside hydrolase family 71/99-like protein [Salinimicrobium sp.]